MFTQLKLPVLRTGLAGLLCSAVLSLTAPSANAQLNFEVVESTIAEIHSGMVSRK